MRPRLLPAALLLCVANALPCANLAAAQAARTSQAAQPGLAYDVTTIKPHKPGDGSSGWRYQEASYEATNISLKMLMADAYHVKLWLIFGLPPWAESARYDIQAKISDVDPAALKDMPDSQRRELLVGLLKDRFGLQARAETKEQPVFELTVIPEGAKLQPTPSPKPSEDGEPAQKQQASWSSSDGQFKGKYVGMASLAESLSYQVERTILDRTGLTGHYDVTLHWTPEAKLGKPQDNGAGDNGPDIFTALKEQLGLRLTAAKAPVPTVVVDKITPPEAN